MKDKKNIIIVTIFFILISTIFFAKTGNMFIDFSRECYIPYQMNNNNALIKDIFLIYGAFGYIINSILYIAKTNINILIIEAHIISLIISILFYFILNKFFTKKISAVLTIIFILISVFSNSTFSFVLPYSYSTLWGIFAIYCILFSLLYDKKNILFLSLGLLLSTKMELFIPTFCVSIFYLIYRKEKFFKNLLYIIVIPLFCLSYFLINKITLSDISNNFSYINEMIKSNSLKYLYKGMGCYFNLEYFKYSAILFLKTFVSFFASYLFYRYKKPIFSYIILIFALCFINTNFSLNLIALFALFMTIIAIKNQRITIEEILLFLFSLILCSKSIFAINSLSYSNFGYCIMIFYTYIQLQKYSDKKWLINSLIIFFIFNFTGNLSFYIKNPKAKYKTALGTVVANKKDYNLFSSTNKFIGKNIKENETFIVLPEGQIFNLIHKKPHNFYNSTFTPLDFDTFKEKNLIENLKKNKPDYVIFYPRTTSDYGKNAICYDYAVDFCKYIIDNYTQTANINDGKNVLIFKIKR